MSLALQPAAPDPKALAGLADVAVPSPVSWYPPAWGWWALAGLLLVAALVLAIRRARRYLANRYRREALEACAALEASLKDEGKRSAALGGLAVLLKRTALSAWPRTEVAALTGGAWVDFLRRHGGRTRIDEPIAKLLAAAEYRPASLATVSLQDAESCARAVRAWIEDHRVSA